jgi:hypothetical protein
LPLRADAFASTASHRAFRDDRDPPLFSGETGGVKSLICPTAKAEYFLREVWTGQITLRSQANFDFARTRSAGQFSLEGELGRAWCAPAAVDYAFGSNPPYQLQLH